MSIFDRSNDTPAEKARHAAGATISNLVTRLAVEGYEAVRHEDPTEGYKVLTRTRLEPPTAGMRAALHVQRVAANLVYEWAMKARAAGTSWTDIGRALGIDGDEWAGYDPAELAFSHLVWGEPLPDVSPSWSQTRGDARWECRSCGQRVTDRGPFGGHPDDVESGHAETCERHRAEVAAYMVDWDR